MKIDRNNNIISYFRDAIYHIGYDYNTFLDEPNDESNSMEVFHGFHSYNLENTIESHENNFAINSYNTYQYNTLEYCYIGKIPTAIAICTIPEKSAYYLNECGEYVSNYIRVDKIVHIDKPLVKKLCKATVKRYIEEYEQ